MAKKISSKERKRRGEYIADGLVNLLSGMGTAKDKASATTMTHRNRLFDFTTWENFYTEFWLARKVVDTPAKDMTREWRKFKGSETDPKQIKELEKEEKRLKIKTKMRQAIKWARLYGGALMIPVFDGETAIDMTRPLEIEKIRPGSLRGITVVDASLAFPSQAVSIDPTSENYLFPETYSLAGAQGSRIHHSRVIRVNGLELPRRQSQIRKYWGQSVISLLHKALLDALTSSDSGASMLHELNIDILSVEGLNNSLNAGNEKNIKQRFETYATLKSLWNLVVVDSTEQFNNRPMQFSNLDKVIEKFYDLVAGATEIPVTKLLGTTARGLNATGEGDQKNYYDFIACEQEEVMEQPLLTLDKIIMMSLWGNIPEDISSEFVSLGQLTGKEQAEIENMRAARDQTYLMNGIVTEAQIASELMQNGTYDNIDEAHIQALKIASDEIDEDEELVDDADSQANPDKTANKD